MWFLLLESLLRAQSDLQGNKTQIEFHGNFPFKAHKVQVEFHGNFPFKAHKVQVEFRTNAMPKVKSLKPKQICCWFWPLALQRRRPHRPKGFSVLKVVLFHKAAKGGLDWLALSTTKGARYDLPEAV